MKYRPVIIGSRLVSCLLVFAALLSVSLSFAQDDDHDDDPEDAHWSYEGEEGPENWGELSELFSLCATGEAQSPIDIADTDQLDLTDIEFNYQPSMLNIFNNGHTIQVQYDAGSSIVYNEIRYNLLQFHFHTPSEHTVNGESVPMELHFVHQDPATGELAVVGVLLREGAENVEYAPIFDELPTESGDPQPSNLMVEALRLLPEDTTYYTYVGSLTTPPCSQGVRWLLLTTPVDISAAQIQAFQSVFNMNARPVQPLNERDLLQDSAGVN